MYNVPLEMRTSDALRLKKTHRLGKIFCQHPLKIRPWNSTWHVQDTLRSNQQRSVARAATPKIAECSQRKRRRNPWAQTSGCIETTKLARRNSLNEKSWQMNKMSKWVCVCEYIYIYMCGHPHRRAYINIHIYQMQQKQLGFVLSKNSGTVVSLG